MKTRKQLIAIVKRQGRLVLGDRVQLRSGGTVMIVNSINGDDIEVVYMYRDKLEYEVFKRHVLRKIPWTAPATRL